MSGSPNNKVSLMTGRDFYKPFSYEEFYDRWKKHERSHWLPTEVSMHDDVNDWKNKLSESQREFLTNIFRFFTQGDVDVAGAYCKEYLPNFCQTPEIAMFLCSVASREAIHIDAYSYLIETLGMPESTYQEFLQYNEMKDKQDYIKKYQNSNCGAIGDKKPVAAFSAVMILLHLLVLDISSFLIFLPFLILMNIRLYRYQQCLIKEHVAAGIALFSGFTEGMQLFSSFTMLLSFPQNGLMKGMGQIVTWSIADETQHTDGMISLFRIFRSENSRANCECKIKWLLGCSCIRLPTLQNTVYRIAKQMVELEDAFINLAFKKYSENEIFMGISNTDLKRYIRYIANKRLVTMEYKGLWDITKNPLPQFEIMLNAPSNTNFFENRNTDYARIDNGKWEDVWGSAQKPETNINTAEAFYE